MLELTIDGQTVLVREGDTLLTAARAAGARIPTLCHHPALPPYGSCRLCVVEVGLGPGAPRLHASCTYPALPGMVVHTASERVLRARRVVLELLLARCPGSETLATLGAELGVSTSRLEPQNDDCIACGLCARMCELRMGRAAIGLHGRGPRRTLSAPFDRKDELCWACGACDLVCPVSKRVSALATERALIPVPNPHNLGLDGKPAIHIPYPQAVPCVPAIDPDQCLHLSQEVCGVCAEVCQAGAIDFDQGEEEVEIEVGAVILAPGYELFEGGNMEALGHGVSPDVLTYLAFERLLSASGPSAGHVLCPGSGEPPERIAFIQCVGSRDVEHDYCSSVCCMAATKQALIAKDHVGEHLECDIYCMDVRAYSKGFEEYYQRAVAAGVEYIPCRPVAVDTDEGLRIRYLAAGDRVVERAYDLVVLANGMEPPATTAKLAEVFGLRTDPSGFCAVSAFSPVESGTEGVYVAGPFTGPKDIPETVMAASGAAARAMALLSEAKGTQLRPREFPPEVDIAGQDPRVGVFICHCGANIASVVNVPEVVEHARALPDVVFADSNLYSCSMDAQAIIREAIDTHGLNRVVVASCTPRTHEPLFRGTIREAGLNPYLFEMANIRDQCSWVHSAEPALATDKARDLVAMAVAKARLLEPLQQQSFEVQPAALVLGGGVSGMSAALALASQGFGVHLVEREAALGGQLRRVRFLLGGDDPAAELAELVRSVEEDGRIHVHTDSRVEALEGSVGRFRTTVANGASSTAIDHGVVIVATGAVEHAPTSFGYGEHEQVVTQLELERLLAEEAGWFRAHRGRARTVVMVQCVGSRDEEHPYCSRICCSQAVKNALALVERFPGTHVYVLYRDMRLYGLEERHYTEARRRGVAFLRYDQDRVPVVTASECGLQVEVVDSVLGLPIALSADLVVLSAGVEPHADAVDTAKLLKVPLDGNGFFLEAHLKLRPVDFATEGVFLCGLAHSAKSVGECIAQAQAAAGRASTILSRERLELEATISEVIDANCDGCAYCVDPCPYGALTLIEYKHQGAVRKTIEVDETACKGCGSCQATCPKQGIRIRGFTMGQLRAQVDAALGV